MREQSTKRRRGGGFAAAAVTAGALVLGALTPPATAAQPDTVQQGLERLVRGDGAPGALATVKGRDGRVRSYTAGVGDLATGAAVPRDGQVRVGSNTKTFTAVVVLQLVAEGRIGLDTRIERYLPGLVRGKRIDGRRITVRHLLQQTSGLPNYTEYDLQPGYYEPRDLVDIALKHEGHFRPGSKWEYSNTNYVLAGLIVQKVTGRPFARELEDRVIRPLGLRHTYFPAPGDTGIREPHPHGYYRESATGPHRDITQMDPSWGWAAGQLVSTNADLTRFFAALLGGRLLRAPQLAQMRTTVPAESTFGPGGRYGLGIVSRPLSCGGVYWGHGGSIPGYETRVGVTADGRAAGVAATEQPLAEPSSKRLDRLVDTALCR